MKRFAVLCLVLLLATGGAIFYGIQYYDAPGPLTQPVTVIFQRGEGVSGIAADMETQGIIRQPLLFKVIAALLGQARKFKAGEYAFSAAITPHQAMDLIASGKVVVHKLTIPEGLTAHEIIALINKEPALEGSITTDIKEGSLLPETYNFTHGQTREVIITKMQEKMTMLTGELWVKRKPGSLLVSPDQAVTLASIVEKETSVAAERGHVASVFINRLKKGMKLQSDPTVVYGIEQDGPLGRSLTTADLLVSTAYNTYTIPGLPPAPICNPGRASLEAALNPLDTDDLYFVATGTGGHNFAATLEQHNKNVEQYRATMQAKSTH